MKKPTTDILCIGHLCHDRAASGYLLGGAASFAGLLAARLGYAVKIMTSLGADFAFYQKFSLHNIDVFNKKANQTTLFENQYQAGERTQFLHARAADICASDIPEKWKNTDIVLFCPIADELDESLFGAFPDAITGITLQGCLRKWDQSGKVSPKAMNWNLLEGIDLVFLSDADLKGFENALPIIVQKAKIVVLTQGAKGATVFTQGKKFHFPAYPAREIDPTGAGDTFAMAFLMKYAATENISLSGSFAHSAASLMIEATGFNENINREKVKKRFEDYRNRFE